MELISALTKAVQDALISLGASPDAVVSWHMPQEESHGDIATPVALQYAKRLQCSPRQIADVLVTSVADVAGVDHVDVAEPGYLNVWLEHHAHLERLRNVLAACSPVPIREESPVIIEYSQPNIAKPLGAHHLLTTLIGQSIANVYAHLGYPVLKWNYIGDWGTQFGKLAVAHAKWGTKTSARDYSIDELLALYVRFHDEAESHPDLEDEGRMAFQKLEQGDARLRQFWEDVVAVTKQALGSLYERLHVSFDLDLGESFYQDKTDAVLEEGRKKGVFTVGENGALIVQFPDDEYPPYLVQKSDGATLYSTRDIAQMRYRIDTYHPQGVYIVTDVAQKLHFEQLIATCRLLGWDLPDFENVLTGRMRFADKSMSTRKGNVLNLQAVLDEAVTRAREAIQKHGEAIQADDPDVLAEMMGIGAVAYGILSLNRKMDMVFDWGKALSLEGNSAPYLQYTHARAQSVLRRAGGYEPDFHASAADALTSHERSLSNTLASFPGVLEETRRSHMPHILAQYLYSLGQAFNAFYNAEPILQAPVPQRDFRLMLTALSASVLRTGAALLCIRVPDRM